MVTGAAGLPGSGDESLLSGLQVLLAVLPKSNQVIFELHPPQKGEKKSGF